MTVAEIERIGSPEISRAAARRAFLEYRRAVMLETDTQRRQEYDGLMRGYRAIARGQQVIDLHQTFKSTGLQADTGYPKLAIARADRKWCRVNVDQNGSATFIGLMTNAPWQRWPRANALNIKLPADTLPRFEWRPNPNEKWRSGRVLPNGETQWGWSTSANALVPIIPPHLHPTAALSNYHILWDAVWAPAAPVDPLLVRHLSGALYAIVAHWDLTPLERAVMSGRL